MTVRKASDQPVSEALYPLRFEHDLTIFFEDESVAKGRLAYNPSRGYGTLIDVETERSRTFEDAEVRSVFICNGHGPEWLWTRRA